MHYKAYVFRADSSAYSLEKIERPVLPASEIPNDSVLVRVRAVSLNYRDIVAWRNLAGRNVDGKVPVSDGAGEVVACGAGVRDLKPGDRVAACFFQSWMNGPFDLSYHKSDLGGTIDGMLQEYRCLNAQGLVKFPEHLNYEQAATLPCAAVTAWSALLVRGDLQRGESILCMGTGGVSLFALQFGHAMGCNIFVTSSSDEKLRRAVALGATHTINYKSEPNWSETVWKLSEGHGIDHIVEVGGPGTLEHSLKCVAPGGQIAWIGVLTGFGAPSTSLFPLMARNARLDGIYVGSREQFQRMNAFLARENIVPVIDRVFEFSESEKAFAYLESGQHFGKVVIRLP